MADNLLDSDIIAAALNPQAPEAEPIEEVEEVEEAEETENANPEEGAEEVEAEAEPQEPKTWAVKAAGQMHDLTEEQLIEYAQKGIGFYANSEKQAKEHKTAMAKVAELEAETLTKLKTAQEYFEIIGESKAGREYLEFLLENDAPAYKRLKGLHDELRQKVADSQKERNQSEVNRAIGLLESVFPADWSKTETRQTLLNEGAEFFRSIGLDNEEIAKITDGAAFVAAIKAKRYDDIMKKAEKLKKEPPAPVKKKVATKAPVKAPANGPRNNADIAGEIFPFLN
jgi:hypothetical protein